MFLLTLRRNIAKQEIWNRHAESLAVPKGVEVYRRVGSEIDRRGRLSRGATVDFAAAMKDVLSGETVRVLNPPVSWPGTIRKRRLQRENEQGPGETASRRPRGGRVAEMMVAAAAPAPAAFCPAFSHSASARLGRNSLLIAGPIGTTVCL